MSEYVSTVTHHHVPGLARAGVRPLSVGACGLCVAVVLGFFEPTRGGPLDQKIRSSLPGPNEAQLVPVGARHTHTHTHRERGIERAVFGESKTLTEGG